MTTRTRWMPFTLVVCLGWSGWAGAADGPAGRAPSPIHVDIPVLLDKADVVFVMDHPVFTGDMPMGMKYMQLVVQRFKETGTVGRNIALFYGEAGYMVLDDRAYDAARKVTTGNPYKQIVADLMKQGVQFEACAYSMKVSHWTNDDLLPGVKVNSGAIGRLIGLAQHGYVQLHP